MTSPFARLRASATPKSPFHPARFPLLAAVCTTLSLPACTPAPRAATTPPPDSAMPTPANLQPGLHFLSWTSPAGAHRYALYVPPAEIARPPYALVVFLHGRGESGSDGVKQTSVGLIPAVLNNPERWPCIILAPQKPEFNPLWPTEESVVMAEIEMIRSQFPIDENRIALTGLSQGGNGTWMFAAAHPDLWSALAPVCGFSRDLPPAQIAQKTRHIPTWAFHGLKDNVVPPEQTKAIIDALRASGPTAEIKYTEFPEANHNSWDAAYRGDGLASWLLSQTRGNRGTSEPDPPSTTNTR